MPMLEVGRIATLFCSGNNRVPDESALLMCIGERLLVKVRGRGSIALAMKPLA